jgi:molybdate transport system substrate-binding protein
MSRAGLVVTATLVLVAALVSLLFVRPGGGAPSDAATRLTVFAAASLTETFPTIDRKPRYSFGGSDQLAFQIRQGAPADVYAAASPTYTQLLYRQGLLDRPVVFATNRLIVLVPRSNPGHVRSVYDLRRPGLEVVIGDPTVPIGAYTRRVLRTLGIASDVLENVVSQATDVKAIVSQVALGQADAGLVYRTDSEPAASRTRTIALPRSAQPPVRYELALVAHGNHRDAAQAFVDEVLSTRGRAALQRAGFGLPTAPPGPS